MYKGKKVAVVVPAYNEEASIGQVIKTIPYFVDRIYVVNDASTDNTYEIACKFSQKDNRLTVINCGKNGGVGSAVVSGHKVACKDKVDVIAVMAGDGQMEPALLSQILDPVVEGRADYAKGNRLSTPEHRKEMPARRTFGNFLLTYLTKIASGYWHVSDPQNGYTVISRETLEKMDLDKLKTGFSFENDMLVKLNVIGARVVDVPHPAKYGKERSKIRYRRFIIETSWLLLKDFLWKLWVKHIKPPRSKNLGR